MMKLIVTESACIPPAIRMRSFFGLGMTVRKSLYHKKSVFQIVIDDGAAYFVCGAARLILPNMTRFGFPPNSVIEIQNRVVGGWETKANPRFCPRCLKFKSEAKNIQDFTRFCRCSARTKKEKGWDRISPVRILAG